MRSLPRLREFVKATDAPNRTLTVVDGTAPESVTNLLASAFDDQPVGVERVAAPDRDGSQVALVEDRSVVATSSLDELLDTYLLVNTDSYRTGTAPVESVEMPTVLAALSETRFHLRGYPASNKEKLLLVVLSRHIERLALEADGGTLRSSFQRLSRIDDERETLRVYERLAGSSVDTHVYGVPDHGALPDGLIVHAGTTPAYRRTWFVVFTQAAWAIQQRCSPSQQATTSGTATGRSIPGGSRPSTPPSPTSS
jgi:hypothetical protein